MLPLWDPHSCPSSQHGVGGRGWVGMTKPGIPIAVSASGVGYLPLSLGALHEGKGTTCFKGTNPSPNISHRQDSTGGCFHTHGDFCPFDRTLLSWAWTLTWQGASEKHRALPNLVSHICVLFLSLLCLCIYLWGGGACADVEIKGQSLSWESLLTYHMTSGNRSQVVQLNDKCLDLPAKPSCWPSTYMLTKLWEHKRLGPQVFPYAFWLF